MLRDKFYRDVLKKLFLVIFTLALCRVTMGFWGWVLVLAGCVFAVQWNYSALAFCYMMFPLISVFNPMVCGLSLPLGLAARFGNLLLGFILVLAGAMNKPGRESLPISWIFAYILVAIVSSIDGWFPIISYLKIAQFSSFVFGIFLFARQMQCSEKGLYELRCTMMAIAIIMIAGSVASKFIPSIGYSMMISKIAAYTRGGYGVEDFKFREGMRLFNGMTKHSQMLAPVVSIMSTWVLCDMLLVAKRFTALHGVLLLLSPVLLFLSRSRGGLLTFVAVMTLTVFVCIPKARISNAMRRRMNMAFIAVIVAFLTGGIYLQIRNDTISKWLRKSEDVAGDTRSLTEAVTSSRMGLIERNMADFYLNPLLGKGFQVVPELRSAYQMGRISWYSAPIEKGVTPAAILGETGLLGASVFLVFLFSFYATCLRRRYLALMNMFTCVLVANLADSTFFSPAGLGGFLWITSCVGGFGIDLLSIKLNRPDAGFPAMPPQWPWR